jgi:hypothetical protein
MREPRRCCNRSARLCASLARNGPRRGEMRHNSNSLAISSRPSRQCLLSRGGLTIAPDGDAGFAR